MGGGRALALVAAVGASEPRVDQFDLLARQLVPHGAGERSPVPRELVRNAALGAVLLLTTSTVSVVFPAPDSIEQSGFFAFGANFAAGAVEAAKLVNGPVFAVAAICLLVDAILWFRPQRERWWLYFCVAQPWAGLAFLLLCLPFVAMALANLALWVLLIAGGLFVLSRFAP